MQITSNTSACPAELTVWTASGALDPVGGVVKGTFAECGRALQHPAGLIGAAGATSGVVHVALALEAAVRLGPRRTGVVCSTDDLGERSASVLQGVAG